MAWQMEEMSSPMAAVSDSYSKKNDPQYPAWFWKLLICWLFVGCYEPTSKCNKKASLGNSLVWLGFDWVGATGFEPAT